MNQRPDFLTNVHHIHLVGIKGVAMTSIAQCLHDLGIRISGSDVPEDFVTSSLLSQLKFVIMDGFDPTHIDDSVDLCIYTGAHQGKQNPEVQEAIRKHIAILSQAEALGLLMDSKKSISVCGTGGKSTTSAMISWILSYAGKNPSYSVGVGNILNLGKTGAYAEKSEWFVAEADEYAVDPTADQRPRFIYQHPTVIVCPNLSFDHPDIYTDFDAMKMTFARFFDRAPYIYVNGDIPAIVEVCSSLKKQSEGQKHLAFVGFSENAEYKISILSEGKGKTTFTINQPNGVELSGTLQVPGKHNVLNAVLALLSVESVGIHPDTALQALAKFTGTLRRFEYKGMYGTIPCYDDYAHTPDEIAATLEALRVWEPEKKLCVAFQPHTFSRTKALFDGFVHVLSKVDSLILLDIFASAREQSDPHVSSDQIAEAIAKTGAKKPLVLSSYHELAKKLSEIAPKDSVFLTIGAGDIYKVYENIPVEKN